MDIGRLGDNQLTAFVAGDDVGAKNSVLEIARDIGFDAVDTGHSRTHACWSLLDTSLSNSAMHWEWVRK